MIEFFECAHGPSKRPNSPAMWHADATVDNKRTSNPFMNHFPVEKEPWLVFLISDGDVGPIRDWRLEHERRRVITVGMFVHHYSVSPDSESCARVAKLAINIRSRRREQSFIAIGVQARNPAVCLRR